MTKNRIFNSLNVIFNGLSDDSLKKMKKDIDLKMLKIQIKI